METNLKVLSSAVKEGDHEQVVELVKGELSRGTIAVDILQKGLLPGIQALEELFKDGQAFLPEILCSVRAMNKGLEVLKSKLVNIDMPKMGKVVLGTVEGDVHDIGKNLVGMMLDGHGFEVIDLGVNVSSETFVEASKEHNPNIVAMSGLLTLTIPYFKTVIEALHSMGLRSKVKVMIGGAPVTRNYADEIGAEGFAPDCVRAVEEAKRLMDLK
jgi:5-methyltetrahydrofolate--homocysteine methyltransferase